jgi:ubiquinone biosynthesis protein Coq4
MGNNAKPLIAQKWEHLWEKPVVLLRAELNVQPVNFCEFALISV